MVVSTVAGGAVHNPSQNAGWQMFGNMLPNASPQNIMLHLGYPMYTVGVNRTILERQDVVVCLACTSAGRVARRSCGRPSLECSGEQSQGVDGSQALTAFPCAFSVLLTAAEAVVAGR